MSSAFRDFVQPIPDEALPQLREQMARAARTASLVQLLCVPFAMLSGLATGALNPAPLLLLAGLQTTLNGTLFLVARSRAGERRPDRLLFTFALTTAMGVALQGLPAKDHHNPVAYITFFLPMVLALFAPWRPMLSIALVPILFPLWLVGQLATHQRVTVQDFQVALCVTTIMAIFAACANQLQRRLWSKLERTRASSPPLSASTGSDSNRQSRE